MQLSIAEKVSKLRGQRSRSRAYQLAYNAGGIHCDGVASRTTEPRIQCESKKWPHPSPSKTF